MGTRIFSLIVVVLYLFCCDSFLQAQQNQQQVFDLWEMVENYAKDRTDENIKKSLQTYLGSSSIKSDAQIAEAESYVIANFFAKASGSNPEIINYYIELFKSEAQRQRLFLLKILQLCGDKHVEEFFRTSLKTGRFSKESIAIENAVEEGMPYNLEELLYPIAHPVSVSFYMFEYFSTGSYSPIEKILSGFDCADNEELDQEQIQIITKECQDALENLGRKDADILGWYKEQWASSTGKRKKRLEKIIDLIDGTFTINKRMKEAVPDKPVSSAKGWALGAAAVLIEANNDRHDHLNTLPLNRLFIEKKRASVDSMWDFGSREELLENLESLLKSGYREGFIKMGRYISMLDEQQYQQLLDKSKGDEETLNKCRVVRKYYKTLSHKNIMGWDLSRYICLCRWGYDVGYLSEEEAWEKIMPVAKTLQKTFNSWEELGRNYLIGRQFWSYKYTKEKGHEFEDVVQRLLDMKSSPWNLYPWDMDLDSSVEKLSKEKVD
ncbi:MAG: DUF1266 domain-containing protein [Planctomycetota bacterium]|jgi:hypothetical protein